MRDPLPFAAYRNERGEFKQWLHTWSWWNVVQTKLDHMPISAEVGSAPCPWVWDYEPDGEFIRASAQMGLFAALPEPWPRMVTNFTRNWEKPLYRVLLPSPASGALERHIASMRSRVVNELDLIALSDRHYRLFPTKER